MDGLLYSFPLGLFSVILYETKPRDMPHVGLIWFEACLF
jgi:hypothetical protein